MFQKRKQPRVDKKVKANLSDGKVGIVDHLSKTGGFLKISSEYKDNFQIDLHINKFQKIKLHCKPEWSNELGCGFHITSIENGKNNLFYQYIEKQFSDLEKYGNERIFKEEIDVMLEHTNAFGNVYFSNFFKYQGICREKMLLRHIPNINEILYNEKLRMVTIDAYNKYINNAYFGDVLIGNVTTKNIEGSHATLLIKFFNKKNGTLIGDGYQNFCCVNSNGKVIKLPKCFDFLDFYAEVE